MSVEKDPWRQLLFDVMQSTSPEIPWTQVGVRLTQQLRASLAGVFLLGPRGRVDELVITPAPEEELVHLVRRAPERNPLAAHYLSFDTIEVLSIDQVSQDSIFRCHVEELAAHGIEQQLWIPLARAHGRFRAAAVARSGTIFTEAERAVGRVVQPILAALVTYAEVIARASEPVRGLGRASEVRHGASLVALSTRELTVMRMCAEGLSAVSIGRRLGISGRTVEKHLERAYAKLGVHDRVSAIRQCWRQGLLGVDTGRAGALASERD